LLGVPVAGDGAFGLERFNQVVGVFLANIFDTEVINHQAEGDLVCVMGAEARDAGGLVVAVAGQVEHHGVAGNSAHLWETIHSFGDFDTDAAFVGDDVEVVLVSDGLGDWGQWDAHVFVALHLIVEVKVLDVEDQAFCTSMLTMLLKMILAVMKLAVLLLTL
jgi:hypothetical protein